VRSAQGGDGGCREEGVVGRVEEEGYAGGRGGGEGRVDEVKYVAGVELGAEGGWVGLENGGRWDMGLEDELRVHEMKG
jgi:hypothetical protein